MMHSPPLPNLNASLSPAIPRFKLSMHGAKANCFRSPQLIRERSTKTSKVM